MLSYSDRHSRASMTALAADEDAKLRKAFGRCAKAEHRQAGIDVVSAHYEKQRWFHCDCRRGAERPPTLFLVNGTHLQREPHGNPHATAHDEHCDFAYEPGEQHCFVRSYSRPLDNEKQLDLVRSFGDADSGPQVMRHISSGSPCPTLARVLCSLLHKANLDRFFPKTPLRGGRQGHDQQIGDLFDASESFTLAPGRPLKEWLKIGLCHYYGLQERLNRSIGAWKRPHGLFIDMFDRIEDKVLYPTRLDRKPLRVTGDMTVFGEGEILRRPPYLVIGLLAQPVREAKCVELLRAYAHPCVAWDRLTLVDSQLERETLKLLMSCRERLREKYGVAFSIEKPLYDRGPPETDNPREVCIPDFILHPKGENIRHPTIVIETMGYDDPAYRERKHRMRRLFEQIGGGPGPAPVIEHARFTMTPKEADTEFCKSVCRAIVGDGS
jgi:hypothetical protein